MRELFAIVDHTVKVLHLNVRLVQNNKGEYLKEIKRRVFEVFQRRLRVANWSGAFKTVDCKKMNQVKLKARLLVVA